MNKLNQLNQLANSMQTNPYEHFNFYDRLLKESETIDKAVDLTNDNFELASTITSSLFTLVLIDNSEGYLAYSTPSNYTQIKPNAFLAYTTPVGHIPVIHMYKENLKKFIQNIENNINDKFYFISDPIYNSYNLSDTKCCSNIEYYNGKIYFMDYEDGYGMYEYYYVTALNEHINSLKIICNMIPDNCDLILEQL